MFDKYGSVADCAAGRNLHQMRAGRARVRAAPRDERRRFPARAFSRSVLAVACAFALISNCTALTAELPCRDLETANADELLATVDRQSIKYGGGVRIGEYDCDPCRHLGIAGCDRFPPRQGTGAPTLAPSSRPPTGCDWRTILEDDRMLDPDHRLMYVLSSHLTGSGSWGDLLVFGCVSGQVRTVYLGQFGTQETETDPRIFDSAPPELQSTLREYMKHLHTYPVDCEQVMTELQGGKNVAEVAKDLKIPVGPVNHCREAAAKGQQTNLAVPAPALGHLEVPGD